MLRSPSGLLTFSSKRLGCLAALSLGLQKTYRYFFLGMALCQILRALLCHCLKFGKALALLFKEDAATSGRLLKPENSRFYAATLRAFPRALRPAEADAVDERRVAVT